jgi:hypothetical protein
MECLRGHQDRCPTNFGMEMHVFLALLRELQGSGLQPTKHVSSEEQLAIFLYLCVTGASNRILQERFERSGDTISR